MHGRFDKVPEGYTKINCTSKSADKFKFFSPFYVGPIQVKLYDKTYTS